MFEQLKMSNKLKRQLGSAVSMLLTVALLVTGLPADLLGGVASVKAEGATVTHVAASAATSLPDGVKNELGSYFQLMGSADDQQSNAKYIQLDEDTVISAARLRPNGNGGTAENKSILFTVTEGYTASIRVWSLSTNSSNVGYLALYDTAGVSGEEVKEPALVGEITEVPGSSPYTQSNPVPVTFSRSELEGGHTYYLATPKPIGVKDEDGYIENPQAVGIYYIEVVETADDDDNTSTESSTPESTDPSEDPDDPVGDVEYVSDPADIGTTDGLDSPAQAGDMTWTFPVKAEDAYNQDAGTGVQYQTNSGNYRGLKIDATTGKFSVRSGDVQFNTGAKIEVPVHGDCEITVTASSGAQYALYTVNGEAASTSEISSTFTYEGKAGYVEIVSTGSAYIKSISVKHNDGEGEGGNPNDGEDVFVVKDRDLTKGDFYDFGLTKSDGYNNIFTAEMLTAAQTKDGVAAKGDDSGANINGFEVKDADGNTFMKFNDGGNKGKHRLRVNTVISGLAYYDNNKKLADADNKDYIFPAYLYDNAGNNPNINLEFALNKGDILTAWVGVNSTSKQTYTFVNAADKEDKQEITTDLDSSKLQKMVFYAAETGNYQLYSSEKLVVGRVQVDHTQEVTVSGSITNDGEKHPATTKLIFTCVESGAKTVVDLGEAASYSTNLYDGYNYKVSLGDANGWVVSEGANFSIDLGAESKTNNITIKEVSTVTIKGNITVSGEIANGTPTQKEVLEKTTLVAESQVEGTIYVPEIKIDADAGTYEAELEEGIEYLLYAEGVNDYEIKENKWQYTEDKDNVDVALTAKVLQAITIKAVDVADDDKDITTELSEAIFTFTNLDDEYVYTFTGTNSIKLREGVYSVVVTNSGKYAQKLTSNLKVEDKAVTKTINFDGNVTLWDFSSEDWKNSGYNGEVGEYKGLKFTKGAVNKTYLLASADSTITVPVKAGSRVVVTANNYQYDFKFNNEDSTEVTQAGGTHVHTYDYKGEDGELTLNVVGQSYFEKIEVISVVEYKEEITVNPDGTGDYKTINEALTAVKAMDRPQAGSHDGDDGLARVEIFIAPGNYEEMLDIDVSNVTLKNASDSPSIELTNEGVDIDENAVRITGYYGHGYTYYSMGTDCKWDAEVLEVNKENGYASFENPGTGKTNGSYWNATVTVQASGFKAEGIIFENSFNQYVSEKAADDVIVPQSGAKEPEGGTPRADMLYGDTAVQDKTYVERAAALAIYDNLTNIYFNNCKFIGRQDTLYGGEGVKAAFYDCSIYGGTDYIFGGMTAVFAKCDLVFNTSENGNDVGHITAAQTPANQRGMLMWNCRVTSTTPGKDTASKYTSKAGTFGRPWAANGEAVFYETVIDATCSEYFKASPSMIQSGGWDTGLGFSTGTRSIEYNTHEMAMDVTSGEELDNSSKRASWSKVLTKEEAEAYTIEAFLGDWNPFPEDVKNIEVPDDTGTKNNMPIGKVVIKTLTNLGLGEDGKGQLQMTWDALLKAEADSYVITITEKVDGAETVAIDPIENPGEGTLEYTFTGLNVGSTYVVSITAVRGDQKGEPTTEEKAVVGEEEKVEGKYSLRPYIEEGTVEKAPLEAGKTYPGGFSVMEDFLLYGEAGEYGTKTVLGVVYEKWVQGKKNASPNKGAIPTEGAALVLDALADGQVTFVCNNSGKNVNFVDGTTGEAIMKEEPWSDKHYVFPVVEGHKYYFYADGSKIMLCDAWVEYGEIQDPDDPSDRTEWSQVAAPEVTSASYSEGTRNVVVTAKGDVSAKGADSLKVVVTNGTRKYEQTSSVQTTADQTFTFEVRSSGTYTVTAYLVRKGEADKASASKTVEVQLPPELEAQEGLHVELLHGDEYTYTGSAIKPAIEVTNNGDLLTEGVDYTVKYKNNVNASVTVTDSGYSVINPKKQPTITVTGKGNLTGSAETNFTIVPKDIDNKDALEDAVNEVTLADELVIAQNTKASPVIYYNGKKLSAKDYTLDKTDKYTTPTGEGSPAELTITGKGNFTGEKKVSVVVVDKKSLKKLAADVTKGVSFTYDGNEHKLIDADNKLITVYEKGDKSKADLDDVNYDIVYSNCVDAGTVKVTVIGKGYYTGSTVTKSYKINPIKAAATDFTVDGLEDKSLSFKSTGATFDSLAVYHKDSTDALVLGKDYKISYSGNKKVGVNKAKVNITFLGNYKGSKAIKEAFSITATPLETLEDVLVTSADKVYSGKPNTYASKPVVTVGGVALKASDYTVKYFNKEDGTEITSKSKLTVTGDSATVEVRVSGKGNYASTDASAYVSGDYKVTVVSEAKTQDLSKAKVTFYADEARTQKVTKLEYTGGEVEPVAVKVEIKGAEVNSDYYTVTYVNNVNKGKATAVINAVDGNDGGFGGGKTATFSIVSKNLKLLTDLFSK